MATQGTPARPVPPAFRLGPLPTTDGAGLEDLAPSALIKQAATQRSGARVSPGSIDSYCKLRHAQADVCKGSPTLPFAAKGAALHGAFCSVNRRLSFLWPRIKWLQHRAEYWLPAKNGTRAHSPAQKRTAFPTAKTGKLRRAHSA